MGSKGLVYSSSEVRPSEARLGRPGPGITSEYAAERGNAARMLSKRESRKVFAAILVANGCNERIC
jgi:hypothetical protein